MSLRKILNQPPLPIPNFQKFLFAIRADCSNTITTADRTNWSSGSKRFEVQVYCLPHPWFLEKHPCFPKTIPWPYPLHPTSSEHVFQWEQLFSKTKHVKSMLHLQLFNHHYSDGFLLSIFSWYYIFLWLQITSLVSLINYDCYSLNLLIFFVLF